MGDGAKAQRVYEDAVAYLCHNAAALRALVPAAVWEAAFPAVRDGDPGTGRWRDAVRALHTAVEDAGIPGGLGLSPTMGWSGWPSAPTPQSAGWVCPTGRCARVDLCDDDAGPSAAGQPPACTLTGRPMRLVGGG